MRRTEDMRRVGAWLIGARGALASTTVVGARAMAHGLAGSKGLVTELPELAVLPLAGVEDLVFGGWDVGGQPILERARALAHEDRAIPPGLVAALEDDLLAVESRIRPGVVNGSGPAARALAAPAVRRRREGLEAAIERLGDDLDRFGSDHRLDTVVVVNVASTEPPVALGPEHERLDRLQQLVQLDRWKAFAPSMIYACAALGRGYPYINFTPSVGVSPPALQQLGVKNHVPFYGSDGKTGETLLKAVLAPLFRYRNFEVLSWEGHNILGGGDGWVLADPRHKLAKVRSKSGVLTSLLGSAPHAGVTIDYVPSLGTWKTAWDHIHFRGFLGTKMTAQFIWQGCDAVLAAPLVLDLIRLAEFAHRRGEIGLMPQLACFFKNPLGVATHSFSEQVQLLLDYVERHAPARRS